MLKSNLKILLAKNDMTQSRLSELTGVRPGTITAIVKNEIKQIPVDAVCKFCELFNCDIGDLWEFVPNKQQ